MDFQLVLVLILSVLTVNLIVVGFYIIVTLSDFRKTLVKLNSLLDDTGSIIHGIANPLTLLTGLFTGIKSAVDTTRNTITSLRGDN